jgi:ATP-dependent RNA helicase SUPV3L1/SUV3
VFQYLSAGHVPQQWFADEVARLDRIEGDVETIAGRISAIRKWAYIAQRPDWLADPQYWAARTLEVEERLSDALHTSLTQRFVDKRTTALMKTIGAGAGELPVEIDAEGEVTIETHAIGQLEGFRFHVAPDARAADKRRLLAAAEKRLAGERRRRAETLVAAPDDAFALEGDGTIVAGAVVVAHLARGRSLARPAVALDAALDCLDPAMRERVLARVRRWTADAVARALPTLAALAAASEAQAAGPVLRSIVGAIEAGAGFAARAPLATALAALPADGRQWLRRHGVTIGALDLFDPRLLKPGAQAWRRALLAAAGEPVPSTPPVGATALPRGTPGAVPAMGYRALGAQAVRIDLVERIARAAHDAREKNGKAAFAPDPALATSMGLEPGTIARLMVELGFRLAPAGDDAAPRYVWRGRARPKRVAASPGGAFAGLADLVRAP